MKIRTFQPDKINEIHQLIVKVYDEFVAPDYSDEGNAVFYDWISRENMLARQEKRISLWYVEENNKIVGMVETRQNEYISLLFVDKAYHGRGIAKVLCQKAIMTSKELDPNLEKYYVHASPYSIEIYRKLGFKETDSMQETNGIKYLPMEKIIQ